METFCSNTRSYFILYGEDFPLEEFTKEIGITPTDAYRKGDEFRRGKNKHTRGVTAWLLETDYVMTDFPEELIHNVVNPLVNGAEVINKYKEKYNLTCKLVAVLTFNSNQTRGITINTKLVEFAHQVKAEFEFDIYNEAIQLT